MMGKLPENIRNLRIMRGLSQSQLGLMLHKSTNSISNWEKGTTSPDVDMLESICKALQVTPNQLYGWDPCPELEDFMAARKETFKKMDDLIKQKEDLEKRIQAYSNELRGRKISRKQ